jgi:hypothetical protein
VHDTVRRVERPELGVGAPRPSERPADGNFVD